MFRLQEVGHQDTVALRQGHEAAARAQRPVRLPDRGDPAEAAQEGLICLVQRELLLVEIGLLEADAPLRHPAEAAGS